MKAEVQDIEYPGLEPGPYTTGDPGAPNESATEGSLSIRTAWAGRSRTPSPPAQTPVPRCHRGLMTAILRDEVQIAKAVIATVTTLDEAPEGYAKFDQGVAEKFVLDPHGLIAHGVPARASAGSLNRAR